ncbi:MAG: hypothetical protein AMXMBFR59_26210 [Rhodanobacteraceae bacterium]
MRDVVMVSPITALNARLTELNVPVQPSGAKQNDEKKHLAPRFKRGAYAQGFSNAKWNILDACLFRGRFFR